MIKIICLGKLKEEYVNLFVQDYIKRINKYHKVKIIELKDYNDLKVEEENIRKYLSKNDYIISMDINGKLYTSIDLAKKINEVFINYSTITFIIGSSLGLSNNIKKMSNELVSFGRITLPHGIFRGVLLEQIYRTFKINNNESYHK